MANKNPPKTRRDAPVADSSAPKHGAEHVGPNFILFHETIEAVVVAFVLAFLFRTFEAEAFVIPTGSMSPSLQGRHKDVACPQCGARFRTSSSAEDMEDAGRLRQFATFEEAEVVGGMCPMCRYPMPYSKDLPPNAVDEVSAFADLENVETDDSYPGDRILVNKYGYEFKEPSRWDVIVFKFPGDGDMNYIKRLVGLPGEELQIYQGDLFTRKLGDANAKFLIERKPPETVAAMLQPVHDTDYESALLNKSGWPLRWAATTSDGWKVEAEPGDPTVAQRCSVDLPADAPVAWLRYRHLLPREDDWSLATDISRAGSIEAWTKRENLPDSPAQVRATMREKAFPELITDFNSYNTRIHREYLMDTLRHPGGLSWSNALRQHMGMNWVGDLAVDVDVEVEEARGELVLDLVEAGYHFRATIDLKDGKAKLSVVDGRTGGALPFKSEAATPIDGADSYRIRFANVDDQLLLWVDGKLVEFANSAYDPDVLFASAGGREEMIPWSDAADGGSDGGDLAPAGVGVSGAKLVVTRLAVLRDVYYIATNDTRSQESMSMDYYPPRLAANAGDEVVPPLSDARDLFKDPEAWPRFLTRRSEKFPIKPGQLFVMGDNSPESADCRLWYGNGDTAVSRPGGRYLDRRLVIGKAVCVFWPHSWGGIPGAPVLPGFPNFGDMRLVR